MSVSFQVYLRDERLPTDSEWQKAIASEGIDLQLDPFDTREHSGFLPVRYKGESCGFEYSLNPTSRSELEQQFDLEPGEPDEIVEAIADRNRAVDLDCHGGREFDSEAAARAAAVLAKISDGVYLDPDGYAVGNDALVLLREQEEDARASRMREAEKWADTTSRRCPECGAPCPEYRETCKACGHKVGRALS